MGITNKKGADKPGVQTSEFWVGIAAMVLPQFFGMMERALFGAGESAGESILGGMGGYAALVAPAIVAGMYALSRGIAKGLGQQLPK